IVLLPTDQFLSIDEHPFSSRKHHDERFPIVAAEAIWPLNSFHALDLLPREFPLAHRYARSGKSAQAFRPAVACIEAEPFCFFQVGEEMASRTLQYEVAGDQFPKRSGPYGIIFEKFDEDLIEILELQGVPAGLDRDIVVRNGSEHLDAIGEVTAQLQVQG